MVVAAFDVIVVGAGSAGAVVAARLSEDPGRHVALLEAGSDYRAAATPPAVAGANFLAACALDGLTWPGPLVRRGRAAAEQLYVRGRGVGGGSAVNAMCGLWAPIDDYLAWGLSGAEVVALRTRVEAAIPLWRPPSDGWTPFERAAVEAAVELGYPRCDDPNAAGLVGVGPAALTVREGQRVSTNDAYLEAARDRPNLVVRGGSTVSAVTLTARRATGVRLTGGEELAAPTVVVCAGALGSPALLLHSGVAVPGLGERLVDHPSVTVPVPLREAAYPAGPDARIFNTVLRYGSGLAGAPPADMQILLLGSSGPGPDRFGTAVAQVAVMASYSEGRVSADRDGQPLVDYQQLASAWDRERLRDGVRRLVALLGHPLVEAVRAPAPAWAPPLPGAGADDAALDRWLDGHGGDYVHATGTARLGAVVDFTGAVAGYEGLHVIDASVVPGPLRANPHLSVVLAAEALTDGLRGRR